MLSKKYVVYSDEPNCSCISKNFNGEGWFRPNADDSAPVHPVLFLSQEVSTRGFGSGVALSGDGKTIAYTFSDDNINDKLFYTKVDTKKTFEISTVTMSIDGHNVGYNPTGKHGLDINKDGSIIIWSKGGSGSNLEVILKQDDSITKLNPFKDIKYFQREFTGSFQCRDELCNTLIMTNGNDLVYTYNRNYTEELSAAEMIYAQLKSKPANEIGFDLTIPTYEFPTKLNVTNDEEAKITNVQIFFYNSNINFIPPWILQFSNIELLQLISTNRQGYDDYYDEYYYGTSIYENDDFGTIPTDIGTLTELQELSISNQRFSGTIPTEIGQLSKLKALDLSHMQLSGTIPTEFESLSHLERFSVHGNLLTGNVPNISTTFRCTVDDNCFTSSGSKYCDVEHKNQRTDCSAPDVVLGGCAYTRIDELRGAYGASISGDGNVYVAITEDDNVTIFSRQQHGCHQFFLQETFCG